MAFYGVFLEGRFTARVCMVIFLMICKYFLEKLLD
jgi:hypothetical protein